MRRHPFALVTAALLLGSALLASAPALSQSAPAGIETSQSADAFFQTGKDLYKAGKLQEAYEAYRSAWSLKHTHDIAANLANSESQLGKMRDAAEHLAFCVRYFPPSGSKAQLERLKGHFEEARREVGAAFIQVNVEGAEVLIDGVSIGRVLPTDEIYLDPGTRTIEVKLKGYEPAKRVVKVAKGPTQTVTLSLAAVAPPTASTAEPATTGKPSASGAPVASTAPVPPPPRSVVPGVILAGVGAAALATGIGFVVDAGAKNSSSRSLNSAILSNHHSCVAGSSNYDARCGELNDTSLSARANRRVGAGLLVGAGVAAAGAAAYFLWPTKKLDPQSSHALRVVPVLSTRDAGFILSGAF